MDNFIEISKIYISVPGAVIIVCITLLVFFLFIVISQPFRSVIKNLKLKWQKGDHQVHLGHGESSTIETENKDEASVRPPEVIDDDRTQALTSTIEQENEKPVEENNEKIILNQMLSSAFVRKDAGSLEAEFQKLLNMDQREMSNEGLITVRSALRLHIGISSAENELIDLEKTNENWIEPSLALSRYYLKLSQGDLAKKHVDLALERSCSDAQESKSLIVLTEVLDHLKQDHAAIDILENSLEKLSDKKAKVRLLDKLFELYERLENNWKAAKILEQLLEISPSDKDRRFKLAYHYSNYNEELLALFHYQILIEQDENFSSTLNNIGVIYENLDLPIHSVSAWSKAAELGQGHPVGNLSISLINHGFMKLAEEQLDNVPDDDKNNQRILKATEMLSSAPENEAMILVKYSNAAKLHRKYVLRSIERDRRPNAVRIAPESIVGEWDSGQNSQLQIESDGDKLSAKLVEVSTSPPNPFSPTSSRNEDWFDIYSLDQDGSIVTGYAFARKKEGSHAISLLGPITPKNRHYFLVIDDINTMSGYYWSEKDEPKEVVFKRS